ncbi:cyclodeaminase/cyclohydrolase family protein [Wansuia hejianensis]|uniref:Cyclodeaminase/cyclohydrolase family protein n=1 Tax=Wansuia hejianensis TaxID=2763667 RepID=A0A926IM68_9FIRM|nr:cyclodeaminase/cyclohydrolase family protein [Wansuia hejianensis]MBC8590894.1 cyclodeaminase/cyclohydrolase family protein [Wansuia hejianensis]
MLIEKSLKDYVLEAASGNPTPGGGSVSALAGSLGTALTNMVGNLTFGKKGYDELSDEVKEKMEGNFKLLKEKIDNLNHIVDEDSKAFDQVMLAFKLPKDTEEDKKLRTEAIQEGYKKALEVPLKCARECYEVLKLQDVFSQYGNKNAITDVGVGALLVYSGMEGALLNVRINLLSIKDNDYKEQIQKEVDSILEEGNNLKNAIMKTVYERLK